MNIIKMHWYKTRKAKGEEPQAQAYQFLEMVSSQQLVTVLPSFFRCFPELSH